jgi:hypothetical protein
LPSAITQGPNPQQPNWTDTVLGSAPGALPVEGSRKSWGTFAELLVPVLSNLDVTAALRHDSYDAIKSDCIYDLDSKLIGAGTQVTMRRNRPTSCRCATARPTPCCCAVPMAPASRSPIWTA